MRPKFAISTDSGADSTINASVRPVQKGYQIFPVKCRSLSQIALLKNIVGELFSN